MSSAASFVDPINVEYREVVKAERAALPHAIKCGELLNLAKENVKAEKMKWREWLKVNCPDIAQETASVYMRLAEHKKLVAKAKSIREARELLPNKGNVSKKYRFCRTRWTHSPQCWSFGVA